MRLLMHARRSALVSPVAVGSVGDDERSGLDEALRAAGLAESLPVKLGLARLRRQMFDIDAERTTLGRFELLRLLGRGATASVHAAYDPQLDRNVALKVFPRAADSEFSARVKREARLAAGLNHPNVVTVYDVGESDGRLWVAFELIEGDTLRRVLESSVREWSALSRYFLAAAAGIDAAHRSGVTHRDIKPENILVGTDGRIAVADFGVATPNEDPSRGFCSPGGGTFAYMSPEQLLCAEVGPSSDQFSFCVMLFEAFAGYRPFQGHDVEQVLAAMRRGALEPLRRAKLPRPVANVLVRGLAFSPEDRFASMSESLARLQPHGKGRYAPLAAAGLVVLAVVLVGGDEDAACTAGASRVEAVWAETQRDALAKAFENASTPLATETLSRLVPQLDRYASQWLTTFDSVCTASGGASADSSLDQNMSCLAMQLVELDATIKTLTEGSPRLVQNAAV